MRAGTMSRPRPGVSTPPKRRWCRWSTANGKVTVNIRRLGQGEAPVQDQRRCAAAADHQRHLSRRRPGRDRPRSRICGSRARRWISCQRGTLIADVRVSSLAQWGAIQTALAGVDNVTGVQVMAMDIGYARLSIAYQGSPGPVARRHERQGFTLSGRAGRLDHHPRRIRWRASNAAPSAQSSVGACAFWRRRWRLGRCSRIMTPRRWRCSLAPA